MILREQRVEHRLLVVLLKLDHVAVRIVHEELQDVIRASATDVRLKPVLANDLRHPLDILDLEAKMPEQASRPLRRLLLEKLKKRSVTAREKNAVQFAGGVAKLVRDFAAQY